MWNAQMFSVLFHGKTSATLFSTFALTSRFELYLEARQNVHEKTISKPSVSDS